jgi:hypothetical protein
MREARLKGKLIGYVGSKGPRGFFVWKATRITDIGDETVLRGVDGTALAFPRMRDALDALAR